jgi:LAO/AO transport system kinase
VSRSAEPGRRARGGSPGANGIPALLRAAERGDRVALARLLSVVERGGPRAAELARLVAAHDGAAPSTVGVTGAPGAGKSTLVGALVDHWRREGSAAVGVLAVDPTSPVSGGAILGDRVRMRARSLDPGVFIRSMATRGHGGGLSLAVPGAVRLLGVAGFDPVVIETVGVGQVEIDVAHHADTTVVVVTPGWGDAVQASKAGLLELADVFVVNKADLPGAAQARRDLEQMLQMGAAVRGVGQGRVGEEGSAWQPPVVETIATTGEGIDLLARAVDDHRRYLEAHGALEARRRARAAREVRSLVLERLEELLAAALSRDGAVALIEAVAEARLDPSEAAARLLAMLGRSLEGPAAEGPPGAEGPAAAKGTTGAEGEAGEGGTCQSLEDGGP